MQSLEVDAELRYQRDHLHPVSKLVVAVPQPPVAFRPGEVVVFIYHPAADLSFAELRLTPDDAQHLAQALIEAGRSSERARSCL